MNKQPIEPKIKINWHELTSGLTVFLAVVAWVCAVYFFHGQDWKNGVRSILLMNLFVISGSIHYVYCIAKKALEAELEDFWTLVFAVNLFVLGGVLVCKAAPYAWHWTSTAFIWLFTN